MFAKMSLRFSFNIFDLSLLLVLLISSVNSQDDTESRLAATNANNDSTAGTDSKCGDTQRMVDECFKDLPPHLMEFLQTTKIAINERDIASKCTVFNRGMKCFDEYTVRCLNNKTLDLFKNNVEGARRFFMRFCSDREFQKDYLQHKDCFSYIQDDWMRCTRNFQEILTEELHGEQTNVTKKFMEFCCARHAYENCIYNSARYKCYKNSAKFARDTAKTLSDEKHFTNCRQYENALCSVGHATSLYGSGTEAILCWTQLLLAWLPAVMFTSANTGRRQA
ncbi:uncharacterized protein LOC129250256 [Anastrepha obliqua]|uniref:uncharacterized protein LOC129250256 n=1 Tax=Anastrepha obliqua TaxID=95512 RepID=UPI00240902D1|nr:uncharacterized protein LOC129250256 [Anastrepha obliqua]